MASQDTCPVCRDRGGRVRQVDAAGDPRPRRGPLAVLRARALAAGNQPAHALAAPARARRGRHRRAPDVPRGPAASRVRPDREGPGARAADRGHARLRPAVAAGRRLRRRRRADGEPADDREPLAPPASDRRGDADRARRGRADRRRRGAARRAAPPWPRADPPRRLRRRRAPGLGVGERGRRARRRRRPRRPGDRRLLDGHRARRSPPTRSPGSGRRCAPTRRPPTGRGGGTTPTCWR